MESTNPKYYSGIIFDEESFCARCPFMNLNCQQSSFYGNDREGEKIALIRCDNMNLCRQIFGHLTGLASLWRPASDPPDLNAMDADWVLGVVSGRTDSMIYDRAVMLVGYDSGEWYLGEDPSVTVSVSYWMPLPDLPEEGDNDRR